MKRFFIVILFFLGIVFGPFFLYAQTSTGDVVSSIKENSDNISIKMSPKNPEPHQRVDFSVESFLLNVDTSTITWLVNGKITRTGRGAKTFSYTLGNAGVSVTIGVVVESGTYGAHEKSIEINPASVDILWEADTYTPPFYKGKALPASQGLVKLVALPNLANSKGGLIPQSKLIYQWSKDRSILLNESGFGKNVVEINGAYALNTNTIEVTVSDPDSSATASKLIRFRVEKPEVVLYERKPLEGVRYENALGGNVTLVGNEITVVVEPYFFSFKNQVVNTGIYKWYINNQERAGSANKSSLTLVRPENASGVAKVRLELFNPESLLQFTVQEFNVSF